MPVCALFVVVMNRALSLTRDVTTFKPPCNLTTCVVNFFKSLQVFNTSRTHCFEWTGNLLDVFTKTRELTDINTLFSRNYFIVQFPPRMLVSWCFLTKIFYIFFIYYTRNTCHSRLILYYLITGQYLAAGTNYYHHVWVQAVTEANSMMAVFCAAAPCSQVEVHRRFRGACLPHHRGVIVINAVTAEAKMSARSSRLRFVFPLFLWST
jgi:hypothetical protein